MRNSQDKIRVILMPGVNGTEALFDNFVENCPEQFEPIALSYPTNQILSYEELAEWICQKLKPVPGPLVLVGESFSGPLSLFVANKTSNYILAVVLVASFVYPPRSEILKYLPWMLFFRVMKPLYAIGSKLLNNSQAASIIKAILTELGKVSPKVLAHRIRAILSADAGEALRICGVPILYLQAENDLIVPKSSLRKILSISESVRVKLFPTQHFLVQELPKKAWAAIEVFVSNLPPDNSHSCCLAYSERLIRS